MIDTRWVYKFKWEHPTQESNGSGSRLAEAPRGDARSGGRLAEAPTSKRTVRARLTVRGIKDSERGDTDHYAGTSSRCSQKLVVPEAARRGWVICTADISKAFLQGGKLLSASLEHRSFEEDSRI